MRSLLTSLCVFLMRSGTPGEEVAGSLSNAFEQALALAEAGEWDQAADRFAPLCDAPDRSLARAATFDFARTRFERARVRPRPGEPPRRPTTKAVADARAQWGAIAADLRLARAALAELAIERSSDSGVMASLAGVVAGLRAAEEGDKAWERAGEAAAAAAAAARSGARGPLKPGAAAARAAVGAPGKTGGSSSGEDEGGGAPGGERALRGGATDVAMREKVAEQLEQVRSEQRAADARRAEAALERAPGRRH